MKHFNEFTLNGTQRGFRAAGRKLLPRDASEYQFGKSARERKQRVAAEIAHSGEHLRDVYEMRVARTREALSTRSAAYVEQLFSSMVESDDPVIYYQAAFVSLGNAQWRYFKALDADWNAKTAQDADDRLMSYARG